MSGTSTSCCMSRHFTTRRPPCAGRVRSTRCDTDVALWPWLLTHPCSQEIASFPSPAVVAFFLQSWRLGSLSHRDMAGVVLIQAQKCQGVRLSPAFTFFLVFGAPSSPSFMHACSSSSQSSCMCLWLFAFQIDCR